MLPCDHNPSNHQHKGEAFFFFPSSFVFVFSSIDRTGETWYLKLHHRKGQNNWKWNMTWRRSGRRERWVGMNWCLRTQRHWLLLKMTRSKRNIKKGLSTWALCCCRLLVAIKWWKKLIDFVEINFHSKSNEFGFNIKFNGFRFNWIEI